MNKRNGLAILFSVVAFQAGAATVLTDANLDQLEAMLPKLQQLEQRAQNTQFNLQRHCDWGRHYRELTAQEKDRSYQEKIEQLVKEYGFTPQQFVELSAKVSYPVLDSVQPMLNVSRQALMFLPAAQRQKAEQTITKGQQYHQTLGSCLTSDDKMALTRQHDRIMQIAKQLGGVEQLLPPGLLSESNK